MTKARSSKRLTLATVAAIVLATTASGSALASGHDTTARHPQPTPPGCTTGC